MITCRILPQPARKPLAQRLDRSDIVGLRALATGASVAEIRLSRV
jgi:hypothetical protein